MQITNSAAIQIEPVVKKASLLSAIKQRVTSLLSATKQGVKMILRPQWKKWKDTHDINRFIEAVWMQQMKQEISADNFQQLRALEREMEQTRQSSRYCFTKTQLRTKQLCGYYLSEQDTNTAFNYAVERHFSALSRGVIPTEDDQSLSAVRLEAIDRVLKNTPAVKDCRADSEASIVPVVLNTTPETIEAAELRIDQLCGYYLSKKDTNTAFNYAVGCHFSALSRGVVPTDNDRSLSRIREEAITQVIKNTPAVKDCRTQDSGVIDSGANMLNAMASIVEATQVVLDATPETTIEVAAEVLLTEAVVSNTTALTDKQLMELRQSMVGKTSIGQLRLPHLKLYAKAHGIKIPGRSTRIKDIKNIIAAAQGSNKLLKI